MEALVVAGLIGAVVVVLALTVRREASARRRRESEAAMRESERVAMGRLAWLTGRSEEIPEVPQPPPAGRAPASAGARAEAASAEAWVVSPRRRLWRDTSALLLVVSVGLLVVTTVSPPTAPDGGVLDTTATPRPVAPATAIPTTAPTPTPRPTPAP